MPKDETNNTNPSGWNGYHSPLSNTASLTKRPKIITEREKELEKEHYNDRRNVGIEGGIHKQPIFYD